MSKAQSILETMTLDDIYRFMETGNPDNAPEGVVAYLECMLRINGMKHRFDKYSNDETIIKEIMMLEKVSRYKAKQLLDDTIEYFYKDDGVSKRAKINFYAEKMDMVVNFAMLNMKTVDEAKKVVEMIFKTAELKGLRDPDPEELPAELFKQQIVVYDFDADKLDLPKADRTKLKEMIDSKALALTAKEKDRLYQEIDLSPFKVFITDGENPRKN